MPSPRGSGYSTGERLGSGCSTRGGRRPYRMTARAEAAAATGERIQQGRGVLRLLAAEDSSPVLSELADRGRRLHRAWCADAFPSALAGLAGAGRKRRLAQLVAVCDVYTWKLLRLDAGLSRPQTHLAILELLGPLLPTTPSGAS